VYKFDRNCRKYLPSGGWEGTELRIPLLVHKILNGEDYSENKDNPDVNDDYSEK